MDATMGKLQPRCCPVCNITIDGTELGQHIGSEHPAVAWRQYAQIYLEGMWFGQNEQDKRLVEAFKKSVTADVLYDLFVNYGVIRTVPGNGPGRLKSFADMLNGYHNIVIAKEDVPDTVEREVINMNKVYGKRPLSAITKSLWMMKQHPIVIYDSNTLEGLRRRNLAPGGNYRSYFDSWFRFFDNSETQRGLDDATCWLPESPAAKRIVDNAVQKEIAKHGNTATTDERQAIEIVERQKHTHEITALAASPLLRNRVTDMRLFYEAGGFL
jgi:hypothetical protein